MHESPLLRRLVEEFHYPEVDTESVDAFLAAHPVTVLFFAGDPARYPEAADVAVVLPELVEHFDGRIAPALVSATAEIPLQERYGFQQWPALVFLRGSGYLGTITRIQDWQVYLDTIERLLDAEPERPPGVGVRVTGA